MPRGGWRGGGRPKGSGRFQKETKPVRIPLSRVEEIKALLTTTSTMGLPLYGSRVAAGFPSPADDYLEGQIDLNQHLILHPSATFLVRAVGDSILGAGIHSGDLLVVDRSLEPSHGKIVIAAIDGELTVKRLHRKNKKVWLCPENNEYQPIDITAQESVVIWGVVTNVIHSV